MNIKDMLEKAIADAVAVELTKVLAVRDIEGTATRAEQPTVSAAKFARTAEQPKTRIRRASGSKTVYIVQNRVNDLSVMPGEYEQHYSAIVKSVGRSRSTGISESDIVKARGRKDASAQNAAQSAIWWLRNHNAAGKRVKPGPAAILRSERSE